MIPSALKIKHTNEVQPKIGGINSKDINSGIGYKIGYK
jgi:hypothetical protein